MIWMQDTLILDKANVPVNIAEDGAHGKGGWVQVVLVPESAADGEAILGLVDNIVDGHNDGEEPSDNGQNLEGDNGATTVRLPAAEGVPYMIQSIFGSTNSFPFIQLQAVQDGVRTKG